MGGVIECKVSDFLSIQAAAEINSQRSLTVSPILRDLVHVMLDNKPEIAVTVQNNTAFLTGWAMSWW